MNLRTQARPRALRPCLDQRVRKGAIAERLHTSPRASGNEPFSFPPEEVPGISSGLQPPRSAVDDRLPTEGRHEKSEPLTDCRPSRKDFVSEEVLNRAYAGKASVCVLTFFPYCGIPPFKFTATWSRKDTHKTASLDYIRSYIV